MSATCAQPDMSGWDIPNSSSYLTDGYLTCLEGRFPGVVRMDFHNLSVSTHSFRGHPVPQEEKQRCISFFKVITAKRARRVGL